MTDPGYPAYRASILLAGGEPYAMPLRSENGFLPDFDDVPPQIRKRARAMFLNYPNNPTGACATASFLAAAVAFAAANDIAVCYDNPYSEIVFDGQQRLSFFSVPGAKDVGIELSSLSKSFNMCGWRIGMTVGNTELIRAMAKVKENTDSGIFNPIQFAAIRALHCEEETIAAMLRIYEARRELVLASLRRVGIEVSPPAGTFYIWVPIPAGMTSLAFTERLLEKAGVLVAAGTAYGACGEGYVRISLTVPDERLREAMRRIERELADGRNGKDSGGAPSG